MGAFYNNDSFFQCEKILVTGMKHKPNLTVLHVIDNMQVEETLAMKFPVFCLMSLFMVDVCRTSPVRQGECF